MTIHNAYVQSMLQGGGAVRHAGGVVEFHHGDGWFKDLASNVWGKAKAFYHRVKPHIVSGARDIGKSAVEVGKHALTSTLAHEGNLKAKLRAGLQAGLHSGRERAEQHQQHLKEQLIHHLRS